MPPSPMTIANDMNTIDKASPATMSPSQNRSANNAEYTARKHRDDPGRIRRHAGASLPRTSGSGVGDLLPRALVRG